MDRREFLRQVAAWTAGAALSVPVFRIAQPARGAEAKQEPGRGPQRAAGSSVVGVAKGKDWSAVTLAAVGAVGGMGAFVKSGNKVVIKPNIGWDRAPEFAANTHPQVVVALVKAALDAGAAQVRVFDVSCDTDRRCYASSGIMDAVNGMGDARVKCEYVDHRRVVPVKIANGKALREWRVYRDALEADCYINVPIAKVHGLSRLTLGMKNIMGVCGGNRGDLHTRIGPKLAELTALVKPKLTVIDATRILLRNGPQGGSIEDVKVLDTVIASADVVAADAYATTLFGLEPKDVPTTVAAYQLGLGEMDLAKIKVVNA